MLTIPFAKKLFCCLCILTISVYSFGQKKAPMLVLRKSSNTEAQPTVSNGAEQMDLGDAGYVGMSMLSADISPGDDVEIRVVTYSSGTGPSSTGKISLIFPSFLSYKSSTTTPSSVAPGKLGFNTMFGGGIPIYDAFSVVFHLPSIGDTILSLKFELQLNTTFADSADIYVQPDLYAEVHHPDAMPKGKTKGVKWLQTTKGQNVSAFIGGIDTSADGKYLFIAGQGDSDTSETAYFTKVTNDGLPVWQNTFNNRSTDFGLVPIQHTADGGCIIATDSISGQDVYGSKLGGLLVTKWDSAGRRVWGKFIYCGYPPSFSNNSLKVLPGGEILFAFNSDTHTGELTNALPASGENVFLIKLSAAGSLIWYKVFSGNNDDWPLALMVSKTGDILITGNTTSTSGNISGYTGPASDPYSEEFYFDAFLLKTDQNGNFLWSKTYSLLHEDYLWTITEDVGNYLLHGFASAESDIPNRPDSIKNGVAVWMLQVDANGNKIKEIIKPAYKGYSGNFDIIAASLAMSKAKDGNYIAGTATRDKYGPFKTFHGDLDINISKITGNGDILWQKQIGGTLEDVVYSLIVDKKGDIVFGGYTLSNDDDIYENEGEFYAGVFGKIGITNTIAGKVFIDKNGNHIKDAGEPVFNDGRINTYKIGDTTTARIFDGRFLNNVDTGTYTSVYTNINNYYTIYPDSKTSTFTNFDQEDSVDFALVPKQGIRDLQISITPQTPARPGFNASYRIITKNVGTETIPNAVVKLAKSSKLTYLNSTRATSAITADTINWAPLSLTAGAIDVLDVNVKLAVPPNLNNGDTLKLTAIAFPQATDTTPANNQATLWQIVQGSYDPNDKTEAHAGIYTSAMKASNEPFQYLVRFQNTGTDTAFYITVKDTLDSRADIKTLEMISTSHPYKLSIEGNIATWQFDMIKLVDSITNEPKSHGYISFAIQPKPELKVGDTIRNKAAIYFDYNLPVITNQALLAFVSPGCPQGNAWNGTVSSAWENAANWSCGTVPTQTTEVLIKAGTPFQPEVNTTTATCKTIVAQPGAHVWVKAGAKLNVSGN